MVKSGVITKVVEVPQHIQLDLDINEAYKLRECLERSTLIPFHIYRGLDSAIKEYERVSEES